MFRKSEEPTPKKESQAPPERVTSILGPGVTWKGELHGRGGVRIEGSFEGEITIDGLVVVDTQGRVTCERIQASRVIISGAVQSDLQAEKVEIRSTGRVWGDVVTTNFSTEEGAYLRGRIQMEEKMEPVEVEPAEITFPAGEEHEPGESGEED